MATNTESLPKIVKIKGSNNVSFTNALHTQFHRKQYELVRAADQTKLHLAADVMNEWYSKILLEVEINKETSASVQTKRMVEKDKERDALLSNIFGIVRAQKLSPVNAIRESAETMDIVLKPYVGIQNEAFEVESAHIAGLEHDLGKHSVEVMSLGLTAVISQLHTVNEEYERMRVQRRTDAVAAQLPNSKVVRPQTDAAFEVVCQYIQAAYLFASADEDRQMIKTLVDGMNQITADFKASHNESRAMRTPRHTSPKKTE